MNHRSPWDEKDETILYRCIAAGMMQEQIAERLGRTKRAIKWKLNSDREKAGKLFPRFVKGAVIRASAAIDAGKRPTREGIHGLGEVLADVTLSLNPLARSSLETLS